MTNQMLSPLLYNVIFAMGIARLLIGLAPFVAAGLTSRMLEFPQEQDSPTARLMARFFGVRDIGLGVLVFYALAHPETRTFLFLFNAAMDGGDLVSILIPLIGRHGIDRAAFRSSLFAATGGLGWIIVTLLAS
jgi:hypothetical protein